MSKLRTRLSYANVMATIAVFIALGGTSYAISKLPKNSVGTKQLKKNAVNSAKVKPDSLTGADIRESTLETVPSAATAQRAESAANAQTLGGLSATQISDASKLRCPSGMELSVGVCFESDAREVQTLFSAQVACAEDNRRLPSQSELMAFLKQKFTEYLTFEWAEPTYSDEGLARGVIVSADSDSASTGANKNANVEKFAYRCVTGPSN